MKRLMISLWLGVAGFAAAQTTNILALHSARFGAAGGGIGDQLYVCAGYGFDGALDSVERLDPATGSVTTLPIRVAARWFLGSTVWRDRLILAGGVRTSSEITPGGRTDLVELVDPVGGTVSNLPPLPSPRSLPALAVVGDQLYAIGGAVSEEPQSRRIGDVSIYDFNLGTWREGPPMPTARECAVAVIGSRIYALGGFDGSNSLDVVEVFDTGNNTWESRPKLAAPQSAHRAVVDGETVYLFGDYRTLVQVAAGNPETGTWRLLDLPFRPARHSVADRMGDRFVVAGGNLSSSAASSLETVQVFTRSGLAEAPTRTGPPPPARNVSIPARQPGEQQIASYLERMAGLSNIALRGTWTMSYAARGQSNELRAPYILKAHPPDRLYLELGTTRLWYDGATLTVADTAAGRFLQTNLPPPLGAALIQQVYPMLDLLPYGHQALIDPEQAVTLQAAARRMRWTPGSNTTWQGRPADTMISPARSFQNGLHQPEYRISVDSETGITVESAAAPREQAVDPEDCRTLEQEMAESFQDHLVLDEVDTRTRWPEATFQATLDPSWKTVPFVNALWPASTRPVNAVARLTSTLGFNQTRWRPPERPAGWIQLWSVRVCAEEARTDYDRYVLNHIPPHHGAMLEGSNLVIRRWSDGAEEIRIRKPDALPENDQGWSRLAWVHGERPEDDRLAVQIESGRTNLFMLLDRQGAIRHTLTDEEAQMGRISVLPAGGERREMLALVQGQTLRLMQPTDGQILQVMRLSRERMEISDRDGDRLPEFTFIGRDISCYEWPDRD